jgi:glycosyltransferase involved in cell wall biosynthesis
VLAVPLNDDCYLTTQQQTGPLHVVWNHRWEDIALDRPILIVWAARWEYDKGPNRLLAIMRELERRGTDFRMCILGQRFRKTPKEFDTIKEEFDHRVDQFGFAENKDEYFEWLRCADIVLSTATHEFQGLSILEAVARGCMPVLPDRLVYPELFGRDYVYEGCGDDIEKEAEAASDMIERQGELIRDGKSVMPSANRFSWSELGPTYAKLIQDLADRKL